MIQEGRFSVNEFYRDRYARTGEASSLSKRILLPAHGIGIRSKKDLDTFIDLRFTHQTDHLGFCITNLAYVDHTFIEIAKRIEEEKIKFRGTAKGEQLKTFLERTLIAVEPPSEQTYWWHQRTNEKILASLEVPKFFKDYIITATSKRKEMVGDTAVSRKWNHDFFERSWEKVVSNEVLLRDLTLQNAEGQKTSKADILIPAVTPIISKTTFEFAKKIIEYTGSIWKNSTAAYFILHHSVLKNDDLLEKILKFYEETKLSILMLKIKEGDTILTDPDREDYRNAFLQIQEKFCEIREKNPKKCTILLEGGKMTYVSMVRGFDIVTNNLSGNNKLGGGKRKKGLKPNTFSRYYVNDRMIFYQYEKIHEYVENELRYTNNQHALTCQLPCCVNVKTLEGITQSIWNYQIARPHFALSMNDEATHISNLIYNNKIQDTKNRLLRSNLCILKKLIPEV